MNPLKRATARTALGACAAATGILLFTASAAQAADPDPGLLDISVGVNVGGGNPGKIPCTYEEVVGGQVLLDNGYTTAELRTAYDAGDRLPVIEDSQLTEVIYQCADPQGTIIGREYCTIAVEVQDGTAPDRCIM
ncbi:hypothetical protein ACFQVC_32670 [Streptomyces monticola]|uniref:Uncharacterized protein n=1 Tax=Streptomyces monticola TaxID=2666263 RepID=A0ABW2JRY7_9ACTN